MRHTKIIATLGPATDDDAVLDAMLAAGVDVVRLNFSHGTHDSHRRTFERARAAAARVGRHVAVMQDLSGPKIRTGPLAGGGPVILVEGERFEIATGDFAGTAARVSTGYGELARAVQPGDRLLLDDGRIELAVEGSDGTTIRTKVVDRRRARPAQGHQRAARRAAVRRADQEGPGRPGLRAGPRRRSGGAQLRAVGRRPHGCARRHRRARRR